jgi:hypothetical protein
LEAYFDYSFETIFSVVDRPTFEAHLTAHFQAGGTLDDDPAWYALRNMVYALGCRIVLSRGKHRQSFAEAQACVLRYFENALSVQVDLMYTQTDISAVQSLLVMVRLLTMLSSLLINQNH